MRTQETWAHTHTRTTEVIERLREKENKRSNTISNMYMSCLSDIQWRRRRRRALLNPRSFLSLSLCLFLFLFCMRALFVTCLLSISPSDKANEWRTNGLWKPSETNGKCHIFFFFVVQQADVRYVQPSHSLQTSYGRILAMKSSNWYCHTHTHTQIWNPLLSFINFGWKSIRWRYSLKHMRNNNDTLRMEHEQIKS